MSGFKLQEGLRPITITTADGAEVLACVFRRAGLAIASCEVVEGTAYSITHEASGLRLAPVLANGTHALVLVAALLSLPLDWTLGSDDLQGQMRALGDKHVSLLHCIASGRAQFVDMSKGAMA